MPKGRPKSKALTELSKLLEQHKSVAKVSEVTGVPENTIRSRARREGLKLPGQSGNRVVAEATLIEITKLHNRTWFQPNGKLILESSEVGKIAKNTAASLGVDTKTIRERLKSLISIERIDSEFAHPLSSMSFSDTKKAIFRHFIEYSKNRVSSIIGLFAFAEAPKNDTGNFFLIYMEALKRVEFLLETPQAKKIYDKFGSVRLYDRILQETEKFVQMRLKELPREQMFVFLKCLEKIKNEPPEVNQPEEFENELDFMSKFFAEFLATQVT